MAETNLLIVLVCFRAVDLTIDCLRSLASQITDVPGTRVAICENGTGGDAVQQLNSAIEQNGWGTWVSVTPIFPNRGFAGGNNVILRDALLSQQPIDYFMLLNADTIVRPGSIKQLMAATENYPGAGVIGPRLEWPDATPQESAFLDFTPLHEFIRAAATGPITRLFRRRHGSLPVSDEPHEAQWISFACALIRREVLEQCGILDEGYYLYFDDADYCRRARSKGWKVLYYPVARVVHLRGRSNPLKSMASAKLRRPRYWYLSRNRYFAKFYGRTSLWLANALWIGGRTISLGRELIGNRERSVCHGEWSDIWTNSWSPLVPPEGTDYHQS